MAETILVVDDDPDIARFVEVNLRSAGYDVAVAADGEEALEKAGELRPEHSVGPCARGVQESPAGAVHRAHARIGQRQRTR